MLYPLAQVYQVDIKREQNVKHSSPIHKYTSAMYDQEWLLVRQRPLNVEAMRNI